MALRIQNNVEAFNAHRNLSATGERLATSMERLSSGYRINRAADDAAGLAISERLRGQIGGLDQAQRNVQDAISLVQTAEGSLTEVHAMLHRIRDLAVQFSNGTLSNSDTTFVNVSWTNDGPVAALVCPDGMFEVNEGQSVTFDASGSIDGPHFPQHLLNLQQCHDGFLRTQEPAALLSNRLFEITDDLPFVRIAGELCLRGVEIFAQRRKRIFIQVVGIAIQADDDHFLHRILFTVQLPPTVFNVWFR